MVSGRKGKKELWWRQCVE